MLCSYDGGLLSGAACCSKAAASGVAVVPSGVAGMAARLGLRWAALPAAPNFPPRLLEARSAIMNQDSVEKKKLKTHFLHICMHTLTRFH